MRIGSIVFSLLAVSSIAVVGATPLLQPASSSPGASASFPHDPSSGESRYHSYKAAGEADLPIVSYCDLVKNPSRYKGTMVRLKANWQTRFEVSALYDPSCAEQSKAWLDFADEKVLCPETMTNLKVPKKSDNEAEVVLTGTFHGPGRYGHLGAYEFKFVATCLEKIKVKAPEVK